MTTFRGMTTCLPTESGVYWAVQDDRIDDGDGLHLIGDGDEVTIYDRDLTEVVWSGVIDLRHQPDFTEQAQGHWIHDEQMGIDADTWAQLFMESHPVTLVTDNETIL